jgi:hypothetical protein
MTTPFQKPPKMLELEQKLQPTWDRLGRGPDEVFALILARYHAGSRQPGETESEYWTRCGKEVLLECLVGEN